MSKKICIVTATRAEYGLLKPVIKWYSESSEYDLKLVVTGAHLSPEFGYTYKNIENDGFIIDRKIDMLLSNDSEDAINKSMALAQIGFSTYFLDNRPDMLIILGDRYETLSVAISALIMGIPIAHLYGGDVTEGAIDDSIRHAITKMSYLHFTSTENYRKRVIQLGEPPERVYNVGSLGVENCLHLQLMTRGELSKSLDIDLSGDYIVVTFHPVTTQHYDVERQIVNLLDVLKMHTEYKYIITKSNADAGGRLINQYLDAYAEQNEHIYAFTSLGVIRYLSAIKYASMVIGNSSSGIVEVPSFNIPTINIGDRQKGRLAAKSVIHCGVEQFEIQNAMIKATSTEFLSSLTYNYNPYEKENTTNTIVQKINYVLAEDKINLAKKFYDIESELK